jgi:hypothetical protein
MKTLEFKIFADYSMIFVEDSSMNTEDRDIEWSDDDLKTMLYEMEGGFIIGTARNMDVPLIVIIHDARPAVNENKWDQIVQCGISLPSGTLSISGTSDYIDDYKKIELGQGLYNALVCYANLGSVSEDGLEGSDSYYLHIWPDETLISKKVIKQWKP